MGLGGWSGVRWSGVGPGVMEWVRWVWAVWVIVLFCGIRWARFGLLNGAGQYSPLSIQGQTRPWIPLVNADPGYPDIQCLPDPRLKLRTRSRHPSSVAGRPPLRVDFRSIYRLAVGALCKSTYWLRSRDRLCNNGLPSQRISIAISISP